MIGRCGRGVREGRGWVFFWWRGGGWWEGGCWVLYRRAQWWWGGTYILYLGWLWRLRWDGWCALTLLTVREAHTVHYIYPPPKTAQGKCNYSYSYVYVFHDASLSHCTAQRCPGSISHRVTGVLYIPSYPFPHVSNIASRTPSIIICLPLTSLHLSSTPPTLVYCTVTRSTGSKSNLNHPISRSRSPPAPCSPCSTLPLEPPSSPPPQLHLPLPLHPPRPPHASA